MSLTDYLWARRWRRLQGFVIAVILVGGWLMLQNRGYLLSESSACIFELVKLNQASVANESTPGVETQKQFSQAMDEARACAIRVSKTRITTRRPPPRAG